MELILSKEISGIRARYGLSLAQFGSLVGAPATSVKRWEAGVDPREQFFFQLYLVVGLIKGPDEVFYDLGRQGILLDKAQWDVFATLIKGADRSIDVAEGNRSRFTGSWIGFDYRCTRFINPDCRIVRVEKCLGRKIQLIPGNQDSNLVEVRSICRKSNSGSQIRI